MGFSFLYRLVHRAFGFVRLRGIDTVAKDAEILVLRLKGAITAGYVGTSTNALGDGPLAASSGSARNRDSWV